MPGFEVYYGVGSLLAVVLYKKEVKNPRFLCKKVFKSGLKVV